MVRMLPRHVANAHVVARRRALPDLSALVRGLGRRRDRRLRGSSRAWTTSSGSASTASGSTRRCPRRTTTGATTSPTTAPCTRTWARSRTSTRWSRTPASAASACCSTWCRTTRATGTRGSSTRSSAGRAHRDCYVWADPAPDGGPPEQLAISNFGGPAWTLRRADRPVLPAPLPARAARPELVERRRARGVRRDPALLVRPRRRRLPHRRLPRDRQGRGAARRPAGDRGRPPGMSERELQRRLLDEPARAARRVAALARGRRRPTTRRGCSSARPTCSTSSQLVPFYGAGRTSCTSRSTSCSSTRDLDAAQLRAIVEGIEAMLPEARVAGLDRLQPRRRPARRPAGRGGDPRAGARGAADAAHAARHAGPLLRRRDRRCRTSRSTRETALDPVARRTGDPADNRDVLPHADAVADGRAAGFTDARRAVAADRRHEPQRRPTSATTRARRCTSCAT